VKSFRCAVEDHPKYQTAPEKGKNLSGAVLLLASFAGLPQRKIPAEWSLLDLIELLIEI
jgi:hypothetical protein